MTTGENGARQIVEPLRTIMALVTLAFGLRVIVAIFDDFVGGPERASDAIWPSNFANGAKALGEFDNSWLLNIGSSLTARIRSRDAMGLLSKNIIQAVRSDHPDF